MSVVCAIKFANEWHLNIVAGISKKKHQTITSGKKNTNLTPEHK
jgi:hypothetical protein